MRSTGELGGQREQSHPDESWGRLGAVGVGLWRPLRVPGGGALRETSGLSWADVAALPVSAYSSNGLKPGDEIRSSTNFTTYRWGNASTGAVAGAPQRFFPAGGHVWVIFCVWMAGVLYLDCCLIALQESPDG